MPPIVLDHPEELAAKLQENTVALISRFDFDMQTSRLIHSAEDVLQSSALCFFSLSEHCTVFPLLQSSMLAFIT